MCVKLFKLIGSILDLIYPTHCVCCNKQIESSRVYCFLCSLTCLHTDHFKIQDNGIYHRLHPRININKSFSLFYYVKEGLVQKAIHKIKYTGRKDLALKFGRQFGRKYKRLKKEYWADYIVPIPIHYRRRKNRGYNQSEEFAKGISRVTNISILNSVLLKKNNLKSQTHESRESRFELVKSSFVIKNKIKLSGKQVLLVDDVLTTGATIEAAVDVLQKADCKGIQIGVIALALN